MATAEKLKYPQINHPRMSDDNVAPVFDTEAEDRIVVKIGMCAFSERVPLTLDRVKELARNNGVKKYHMKQNGAYLRAADFPLYESTADVVLKEYNEAK